MGAARPKYHGKNGDTSPRLGKPEASNVPALIFEAAAPNHGAFPGQAGFGASAEHLGGASLHQLGVRARYAQN